MIVQPPAAAADGKGENTPVVTVPPILRIRDLINGSGAGSYQVVQVYVCDDHEADGCLHPTARALELVGLKQQVEHVLLGASGGDGLIAKFATNTGTLTDGEKAFMELVPDALGALIRNLAREDVGMARLFAEEGAPVIALELAQLLVQIRKAANSDSSPAELEYDVVGGGIYDLAQTVSSLGSSAMNGFLNAFNSARSTGSGIDESFVLAATAAPEDECVVAHNSKIAKRKGLERSTVTPAAVISAAGAGRHRTVPGRSATPDLDSPMAPAKPPAE